MEALLGTWAELHIWRTYENGEGGRRYTGELEPPMTSCLRTARRDLTDLIRIVETWAQEEEQSPTLLIREGMMNHWQWIVTM